MHKTNSQTILLGVAAVVLVGVIVASLSLRQTKSPSTAPIAPSISQFSLDTTNWQTVEYTHPSLDFSMKLPPDWIGYPLLSSKHAKVVIDDGDIQQRIFVFGPKTVLSVVNPDDMENGLGNYDSKVTDRSSLINGYIGYNSMKDTKAKFNFKTQHQGKEVLYLKDEDGTQDVMIPIKDGYYLVLWNLDSKTTPIMEGIISTITLP